MAGNSEMIDLLVSKDALDSLDNLNKKLGSSYTEMEKLLAQIQELNTEFSKSGKSWSDLSKSIEKYNEAEKKHSEIVNAINNDYENYLKIANALAKNQQEQQKVSQQNIRTKQEEEKLERQRIKTEQEKQRLAKLNEKTSKQNKDLNAVLSQQVKTLQDLTDRNNALIALRKTIDLTTEEGRKKFNELTREIAENQKQLKEYDSQIGNYNRNVGNYGSAFGGFGEAIKGLGGKFAGLGAIMGAVSGGVGFVVSGIAEAVSSMVGKAKEFISAGIEMASVAEGVTRAFERMNNPDLLKNLRKETKGLITDFQLMQSAIQAKNFGIPIEKLGTLLKFAQQRAQETGQSVDYLADSIIMGLGRKSPLILDNLGISAVKLREETKKTGDFASAAIAIINDELEKQGDLTLTSADKAMQASIKWQNVQTKTGEKFLFVKNIWSQLSGQIAEKLSEFIEKYMPKIVRWIEDIINELIELYNSSIIIRVGVQSWIAFFKTYFEEMIAGIKFTSKAALDFAKIMSSAFKLDLNGVRAGFRELTGTIAKYAAENANNIIKNSKKAATESMKELKKTDLSKLMNGNASDTNKPYLNTDDGDSDKSGKDDGKAARLAAEYKKSVDDLNAFRIKSNAETNKTIADDDTRMYEERRKALKAYIDYEISAVELQQEVELYAVNERLKSGVINEETAANQRQLINERASDKIREKEREYGRGITKLNIEEVKKRVDEEKEIIGRQSDANAKAMLDELVKEAKNYEEKIRLNADNEEKRRKITEDYQKKRLQIIHDYNQKQFREEIAHLQKMLAIAGLTEEVRKEITKRITDIEKNAYKEAADYEIKLTEDSANNTASKENKLSKFLNDQRTQAVLSMWNAATDIANSYYDNQLQRIDELAQKERDYWSERTKLIDESVQSGLMSQEYADERKKVLEAEQLIREKQIDDKRREMQRKQAVWQKANAIVQATITGAQAVLTALKAAPPPFNAALAAITGALVAAQIEIIKAQKIPSYREGTKGHPGGLALVGDGGRSEAAILPDGRVWKTPDRDTLALLPRGTEVLPDYRKAMEDTAVPRLIKGNNDNQFVYIYDSRQRELLEQGNSQLSQMNRGISALRGNSRYAMQVQRRYKMFEQW
ncbi:MAG: hypothetical protein FWF53_04455 [Candidatus Azobacteroides sp.]|nr:hypothetical protein [Candidatus Azobacteroides sp.]